MLYRLENPVDALAKWHIQIGVVVMLLIVTSLPTVAQEKNTAAVFFPSTTAIYLEIEHPDQLIGKVETHPIVNQIGELKPVKRAIQSPQFAMALLAKGLIETQIEQPLLDAIKDNMSAGLSLGFDSQSNALAIVFKSSDEAKLRKLAGTILNVVATGAKQEGNDPPFKKKEYRNAVAAEFDGFIIARFESWFVISNKKQLAKTIVDNLIDGTTESLADEEWFQSAKRQNSGSDAWVAVNLETIRAAGVAKELFQGRTDNPGAELILGGLFDALKHAPIAVGDLKFDRDLKLSFAVPFDQDWATDARRFFFGEQFQGFAPEPLLPKSVIANLVSYRDIADWWLSKEDLFEENVIAQWHRRIANFRPFSPEWISDRTC